MCKKWLRKKTLLYMCSLWYSVCIKYTLFYIQNIYRIFFSHNEVKRECNRNSKPQNRKESCERSESACMAQTLRTVIWSTPVLYVIERTAKSMNTNYIVVYFLIDYSKVTQMPAPLVLIPNESIWEVIFSNLLRQSVKFLFYIFYLMCLFIGFPQIILATIFVILITKTY